MRLQGLSDAQQALLRVWAPLQDQAKNPGNPTQRRVALDALLEPYSTVRLFDRAGQFLDLSAQRAIAATEPSHSPASRMDATAAASIATDGAIFLFSLPLRLVNAVGIPERYIQLTGHLTDESFLRSLAAAAEGAPALAARLAAPHMHANPRLTDLSADLYGKTVAVVMAAATIVRCILYGVMGHLSAMDLDAVPPLLPAEGVDLIRCLDRSRLLPAVCGALMRLPAPASVPGVGPQGAEGAVLSMEEGAAKMCDALGSAVAQVCDRVARAVAQPEGPYGPRAGDGAPSAPPPAVRRQAEAVLGLLRGGGPELVRLQRAVLGRLAARGGGEEAADGQGRAAAGSGAGGASSGSGIGYGGCWAAMVERQRLAASLRRCDAAGEVEPDDCTAVTGSVGVWGAAHYIAHALEAAGPPPRRQAQPPPPAAAAATAVPAPPPVEVAALAVPAARALSRLSSGRGLAGAYRRPKWGDVDCFQVIESFSTVLEELPKLVPRGEARAMAPDCLEVGAAALGWACRAAAGSPPSYGQPELRHEEPAVMVRSALAELLSCLAARAFDSGTGFESLRPDARADCAARLAAAGLTRSLDAALRLAWWEEERLAAAWQGQEGERSMEGAAKSVAMLLNPGLTTSAEVTAAAGAAAGAAAAGAAEGPGGATRDGALGLVVTASKRARLLAARLAALPQGPVAAPGMAAAAEWGAVSGLLTDASHVAAVLPGCMRAMEHAWPKGPAGESPSGSAMEGAAGSTADPWVACVSAEHEALSLALRSGCALTTQVMHQRARFARSRGWRGSLAALDGVYVGFGHVAHCLAECARGRDCPLPVPHLLATQPHRLLAAVCEALPGLGSTDMHMCARLASTALVALASHEQLAARVHEWLAPPPPAAAAEEDAESGGSSSSGLGGPALRGCLRGAVEGAVLTLLRVGVPVAAGPLALLRAAAGGGSQALRSTALLLLQHEGRVRGELQLPDGTTLDELVSEARAAAGASGAQPPLPAALPPALALPAAEVALPRLRLCAYPLCHWFVWGSEEEMRPRQCGGCRAVRYCRPECQRAHWAAGHKAECGQLKGRQLPTE